MKNLQEIIKELKPLTISGNPDIVIRSICIDSRDVEKDSLFIAIKGTNTDGHEYINKAVDAGAKVVVCETLPSETKSDVTYIAVNNCSVAAGIIASCFYDKPSSKLTLTGVTGTNGKTTVATLLYKLFRNLGYNTGAITTICSYINDCSIASTHTTPDAITINRLLKDMVDAGVTHCFMEVSSHAIDQDRISALEYRGALFTNITHDHLDYHKTFDAYIRAKKKYFDSLPEYSFAIINADDKNGRVMVQNTRAKTMTYGIKSMTDFKARVLENSIEGMHLNIDNTDVWVKLSGEYNAYNILCIYSAAIMLGLPKDDVLQEISRLNPVRGRMECIRLRDNITGIVDYAHTPDAVENILMAINKMRRKGQNIITIIGAGGNRDKTKRPIMAKTASDMSDKTILTSDNPRNEVPEDIINDMKEGVKDKMNVVAITDRREAIRTAAMLAQPNDIILVAGKGHEDYQEIKGVKHIFDDKQEIIEAFKIK